MGDWSAWLKSVHFGPHWLLFAAIAASGMLKAWQRVLADKARREALAQANAGRTRGPPEASEADKAAFSATLLGRPLSAGAVERLLDVHRQALARDTTPFRRQIAQGELTQALDGLRDALLRQITIIEDYRRRDPREMGHDRDLKAAHAALADIEILRVAPPE